MRTPAGRAVWPLTTLSIVAVTYVLVFLLLYWLSVRTVAGREFGDAALRGALSTQEAAATTVDALLDVVSVASLAGALAVVATIALVRLARITGLAAIGLIIGANATTWLLKEVVLDRPDLGVAEYTPATLNSMPSGHSTAVLSAVAATVFVLPHRTRLPIAVAGSVAVFIIGMATMSAGWHRAGDSVAAFLVVGFWTTLAAILVGLAAPPTGAAEAPSARARWFGPAAAGALALALALALGLDAAPGFRDSSLGQTVALLAGACFIAGTAAGVLLAILRVLEIVETPA